MFVRSYVRSFGRDQIETMPDETKSEAATTALSSLSEDVDVEEWRTVVLPSLTKKRSRDPRDVRLAAVTSAVTETVNERRGGDSASAFASTPASASETFAAALTALEACFDQEDGPRPQLVRLLDACVPHVAPRLLASSLGLVGRCLRASVAAVRGAGLAAAEQQPRDTADGLGGANAELRSIVRTTATVLETRRSTETDDGVATDDDAVAEVRRLLDGALLTLFDDRRPRVRRTARTAVATFLRSERSGGADAGRSRTASCVRDRVGAFLTSRWREDDADNANATGDERSTKTQCLTFAEEVYRHLTTRHRSALTERALRETLTAAYERSDEAVMLHRASLSFLAVAVEEEEEEKSAKRLAGTVLASTVQSATSDAVDDEDCLTLRARLMVSCCVRLDKLANKKDDGNDQDLVALKLVTKLVPVVVRAVLARGCHERRSDACVRACATELVRLARDADATSAVPDDVPATVLRRHEYRARWDVLLPAYAALAARRPDGGHASARALIDARGYANDDASRRAVEDAVGVLVRETGVENVWTAAPLDEKEPETAGGRKKRKAVRRACIGPHRAWLLPLFHAHSKTPGSDGRRRPPRLEFFRATVLGLARECDVASHNDDSSSSLSRLERSVAAASCVDLWGLLGGFFTNDLPSDFRDVFPALATRTLLRGLADHRRYPRLIDVVCDGLVRVAETVKERGDEEDKRVLAEATKKILPALFTLVDELSDGSGSDGGGDSNKDKNDDGDADMDDANDDVSNANTNANANASRSDAARHVDHVTRAVRALAAAAPPKFLRALVRKLLARSVRAAADADHARAGPLLDLSRALVEADALDASSARLLYRTVATFLRDDRSSPASQKRAYRTLHALCERRARDLVAAGDDEENEEGVVGLLTSSLATTRVAARSVRLSCLERVLEPYADDGIDADVVDRGDVVPLIPRLLGEALQCLKDSNAKTRESAHRLLLLLCEIHRSDDDAGGKGSRAPFLTLVLGALGGASPSARSAAVTALSRLVYEHARHDPELRRQVLPKITETVLLLFDDHDAREVVGSVVAYCRVAAAALDDDLLKPLLPNMLGGLFKYDKGRGRFRAKIKIVLKRLVRRFGHETVAPLVPEKRLVAHLRRTEERERRKRERAREAAADDDGKATVFDDMMDTDEEDSDDGRTLATGATGFTQLTAASGRTARRAAVERTARSRASTTVKTTATTTAGKGPRLREEKQGEVFDLLDASMTRKVRFANDEHDDDDDDWYGDDDDDDDGGVMEFDDDGRLVVPGGDDDDDRERKNRKGRSAVAEDQDDGDDEDDGENAQIRQGAKRLRLGDGGGRFESAKAARAASDAERSRRKQKHKHDQINAKGYGSEFASKKAGGDVRRKGAKFEPYAYVPLDGKSYTKKNRRKAVSQMSSVVKKGKRKRA